MKQGVLAAGSSLNRDLLLFDFFMFNPFSHNNSALLLWKWNPVKDLVTHQGFPQSIPLTVN